MKWKRIDEGQSSYFVCPSDQRLTIRRGADRYLYFALHVGKKLVNKCWRLAEAKRLARKHWRPDFLPDLHGVPKTDPAHALYRAAVDGDAATLLILLDRCEELGLIDGPRRGRVDDRTWVLREAVRHGMVTADDLACAKGE